MRFVVFMVLFVGLAAAQVLALHFIDGFQRIYAPFDHVVEPFVGTPSGGNYGALRLVVLWANILGISVYSAVLAGVGAFLTSKTVSKSSSHV